MTRLAKLQVQNVKRESPLTAMAGRLMLAELSQNEMSFKSIAGLSVKIPAHERPISFSAEEFAQINDGDVDAALNEKLLTVRKQMEICKSREMI